MCDYLFLCVKCVFGTAQAKATGGASEASEASGADRRVRAWGGDSVFIIS